MIKMFYEVLPKWNCGKNKGRINWKECIGYMVKFIYDDIEGEIEIISYFYENGKPYLYIKYNDKDSFKILTYSFLKCAIGGLLYKYTNEFKVEIGQIFKDDKRDLIITNRQYREKYGKNNKKWNDKWYKYTCNKCGYNEGWMTEGNLLIGNGCSCCRVSPQMVIKGINDIPTTAPWMIKYFQGGTEEAKLYNKSSGKKIKPICPDCGRIKSKEMPIYKIYDKKSIGCTCGDGIKYPNKFMFNLLEQLNIEFTNEYSPEWVGLNRYDFYFELKENEYIIEAHGIQHYEETNRKGARKLEEEIENDRIKKELALSNGIKKENYIVINCRKSELEWIRDDVLISRLDEIFNLDKINWLKCEEFALSNLCKKACQLKSNNPNLTTTEIGEIMRVHAVTIINYLKKGTKLGWCYYDSKEEMRKTARKNGKGGCKQVEAFKDGVSLGIFESAKEIERQSLNIFGIQLDSRNISTVCNGKRPHHKGFTFKFV